MTYCQRDPRWASHPLGYGPATGTIGAYGCLDTTWADVCTWSGHTTNPAQLDELFTAAKIFQRDPTGTFDFLPDDALAKLWPARFKWLGSYSGYRADIIAKVLPTKDQYAAVALVASGGRSHFAPIVSAGVIGDPWVGTDVNLGAYTNSGWSVIRTIVVQALPTPPIPKPPAPTPLPTPVPQPIEPMAFYSFHPTPPDDLHPADGVMALSVARTLADDYLAWVHGVEIDVQDVNGAVVYTKAAP